MKKIMSWIVDHPRLAVILLVLALLASLAKIGHLEIDSSAEGLMVEGDPARDYYEEVKEKFGNDNLTVVVVKSKDIFNTETLTLIENLTNEFLDIDGVGKVVSLTTVNRIKGEGDYLNTDKLIDYVPEDPEGLARIREDALCNEIFLDNIVSPDAKVAAINIYTESRLKDKTFNQVFSSKVDEIINKYKGNHTVYQLGTPLTKVTFSSYIEKDQQTLIPWSVLVLFVILLISFRSAVGVGVPLLTASLSIACTLGFMTLIGYPINVITAIVPSLLIAVGCTEDVHMISEYYNGLAAGVKKKEAVRHMALGCGLPIFLTSLTTFLGFATLSTNKITILKQFGIAASFGLMANFIITIVVVPVALRFFGLPRVFKKKEAKAYGTFMNIVLDKIGHINIHQRKLIAYITVVIMIFAIAGATRLKVNTDFISYFKENTFIRQRNKDLHEVLSGGINFYIVVETGEEDKVKEPSVLRHIAELQEYIKSLHRFDKTISLADYIMIMNREMYGGNPAYKTIPHSRELIAQYLLTMERDQIDQYVDFDYSTANILVRHNVASSWELSRLLKKIQHYCKQNFPEDLKVNFTGEGILINNAADAMVTGQVSSLSLALLAIFTIMSILFVSLKAGFLSMIPNMVPIALNFGLMGWLGIPLNTGTCMVAAIALGIAVDDTVHFMVRYQRELKETNDQNKAIFNTLLGEGRPIIFTSISLCLGFIVLVLSNFNPTINFGFLAAWVMIWALISDLFLTPLLLSCTQLITIWDLIMVKLTRDITEVSPLFSDLKPSEAKKVVLLGGLKSFSPGEYIIRQGEKGEDMYMVVLGKVKVTIDTPEGEKEVATLSEGGIFGEMALVEGTARSANVIAVEDTELLRIDEKSLDRIRRRFPSIAAKLFLNLSKVLSGRLRKAQV